MNPAATVGISPNGKRGPGARALFCPSPRLRTGKTLQPRVYPALNDPVVMSRSKKVLAGAMICAVAAVIYIVFLKSLLRGAAH